MGSVQWLVTVGRSDADGSTGSYITTRSPTGRLLDGRLLDRSSSRMCALSSKLRTSLSPKNAAQTPEHCSVLCLRMWQMYVKAIYLNGVREDAHEDFVLSAADCKSRCKVAASTIYHKPYGIVGGCILLRAFKLAPTLISIG